MYKLLEYFKLYLRGNTSLFYSIHDPPHVRESQDHDHLIFVDDIALMMRCLDRIIGPSVEIWVTDS